MSTLDLYNKWVGLQNRLLATPGYLNYQLQIEPILPEVVEQAKKAELAYDTWYLASLREQEKEG